MSTTDEPKFKANDKVITKQLETIMILTPDKLLNLYDSTETVLLLTVVDSVSRNNLAGFHWLTPKGASWLRMDYSNWFYLLVDDENNEMIVGEDFLEQHKTLARNLKDFLYENKGHSER